MKRILIAVLAVVAFVIAFAAPVFAGEPPTNLGQVRKATWSDDPGTVAAKVAEFKAGLTEGVS